MSTETNTTTRRRTVTAFFDNRSDADAAVERLVKAGVDRGSVSIRAGNASSASSTASGTHGGEPGFWESLKDLFLPDEDRETYAEGLRRGGFLVTAQVADTHYEKAIDILDDEGTVDLDQRASAWRKEGWTGYTGQDKVAAARFGTTGVATGADTSGTKPGAATGGMAQARGAAPTGMARASGAAGATGTLKEGREEAIPVVEEQLRVGKREVEHGRVRVRSYVVETPVEEQVSLRQERVNIERRPVDRPATEGDALFRDRTIEATETTEEAVVSKEARVKEEISIGKTAEQRTETVSDKVRRTEVEVEDERGQVSRTGTGTAGDRRTR